MNRQQKAEVVEVLKDRLGSSTASFLVDYQGLSVLQMQTLRRSLKKNGGMLTVAKARLMKRAVDEIESMEDLKPSLKNQVALVFASDEPPAVAKVLHDFAKNNEQLRVVIGYLDGAVMNADDVSRIAKLPSREVLLGQLCGTLQAPVTNLAGILNMLVVRLLVVLKQVGEKQQNA